MKKTLITTSAVLLAVPFIFSGCGKKTIDVNQYLTIETEGYDTIGTAHYSFDSEAFVEDNTKAFEIEDDDEDEIFETICDIEDYIDGKLNKTESISNGDKLTFKWDEDNLKELEEDYEIRLKYSDKSFDVSGLEEATSFNPFDFITVSFTGMAPKGEVNLNVSDDMPVHDVSVKSNKTSGLSTGDKIKVTVEGHYDSDFKKSCIEKGYIPTELEKEFTVEGLSSYAQKIKDIPKDAYDKMDKHAQDTLNAHVAGNWSEKAKLKKTQLIGNYLLTPKDPSIHTSHNNKLYYIYKLTIRDLSKEDENAELDYYYYSSYTDIVILDDGTCSFNLSSLEVPEASMAFGSVYGEGFALKSFSEDKNYYYSGYQDLDSLFNKHVTSNIDKYNYESTVK